MKKAELICIPGPGYSHLVSMLEFSKHLADRDPQFSITILIMKSLLNSAADSYIKNIAAAATTTSLGSRNIKLVDLPKAEPPPEDLLKYPQTYMCTSIENYKPLVKDFITSSSSISDHHDEHQLEGLDLDFFCSPMVDVGNEFGLPCYLFSTSGLAFVEIMLHLPSRHDRVGREFEHADPDLILPGFVNPIPSSVWPSPLFDKDDGYIVSVNLAKWFLEMKGIIANTFFELEPYAWSNHTGQTLPVYPVGPVVDLTSRTNMAKDRGQQERIMKWLDEQPSSSVVYLCFGSMGKFSTSQVNEIALALERSGKSFLWVVHDLNDLPENFLRQINGRGMVCNWTSQPDVLAHKAAGAFVSHCGWNSILESMWFGVPILTWPLFAEQQLNAFKLVRELGLAVEMKFDYRNGDLLMADEIEKAIKCLIEGDGKVRERVKKIRDKSRKAVIEGGSSFVHLGRLIENIKGNI